MDLTTRGNIPGLEVHAAPAGEKCAICSRRTSEGMFAFHECVELAVPCQTWLLCQGCAAAIMAQLEHSAVHSPLRIRIAVGLVAAERRPRSRHTIRDFAFWDEMSDQQMDGLMAAFVLFMFLMPPLVFLLVTVFAVIGPLGR